MIRKYETVTMGYSCSADVSPHPGDSLKIMEFAVPGGYWWDINFFDSLSYCSSESMAQPVIDMLYEIVGSAIAFIIFARRLGGSGVFPSCASFVKAFWSANDEFCLCCRFSEIFIPRYLKVTSCEMDCIMVSLIMNGWSYLRLAIYAYRHLEKLISSPKLLHLCTIRVINFWSSSLELHTRTRSSAKAWHLIVSP